MKRLLSVLILSLLVVVSSCNNSRSGNRALTLVDSTIKLPADSVVFRARYYYIGEETTFQSNFTELLKVPFGYRPGDTILVDRKYYVLRERVK